MKIIKRTQYITQVEFTDIIYLRIRWKEIVFWVAIVGMVVIFCNSERTSKLEARFQETIKKETN